MQKKPIIFYIGKIFTVECAIRSNDTSESKSFIDGLSIPEKAKIIKVIKRYADFGRIANQEQFKKVEGDIWEFKNYQTRILMYHCSKGHIALTQGFKKKVKRTPKNEIKKANEIIEEYNEIRKGLF